MGVQLRSVSGWISKQKMYVQGDTSGYDEPPVDFRSKVLFWPGLSRPGKAKMELLFWNQLEVRHNLMCHPMCVSNPHCPLSHNPAAGTRCLLSTTQKKEGKLVALALALSRSSVQLTSRQATFLPHAIHSFAVQGFQMTVQTDNNKIGCEVILTSSLSKWFFKHYLCHKVLGG